MNTRFCPRCRAAIVAGMLCPKCGFIESAHDPPRPPLPEECPLTDAERRRWRIWFWLLLLLGPAISLLSGMFGRSALQILPQILRSYFDTSGPLLVLGVPVVTALGAAFCLARSQAIRRDAGELFAYIVGMSFLLLFAEAAIMFVGCGVLAVTNR